MTNRELEIALRNNKYLILKNVLDKTFAVNCKVVDIGENKIGRIKLNPDDESTIETFKPCNFNEYISNKLPFIT